MKKILLSIFCFMLAAVSINAQEVFYTLTPAEGSNQTYDKNCDIEINGIKWNLTGNSTMDPWRIGGKSITAVDRTLYSKTPMDAAIDKVVLSIGTVDEITVNSAKLLVADNADFANAVETSFTATANTDVEIPVTAASGSYFKFVFNVTVSASKNKFIQIKGAEFYKAAGSAAVTAKPTFTPSSCTFEESFDVNISAEEGATIYYTIDGTDPTTDSDVFGEDLTIEETTIVKAIAVLNGVVSSVATAEYTKLEVKTIAEVIEAGAGDAITTGTVVATYTSGILLNDATGSILVYQGKANIGDVVKVKGTTSEYAGLLQFGAGSTVENTGTAEVVYPEAVVMDGAAMDAYLTAPSIQYVEYTGVLNISGNYYNVTIEGATKAQGSISYPAEGLVTAESGDTVKVTGYTIGVSSSKYVNTMAVKVEKVVPAEPIEPTSVFTGYSNTEFNQIKLTFDEYITVEDCEVYATVYNANDEVVLVFNKKATGYGDKTKMVTFSNSTYGEKVAAPGEYKIVVTAKITSESGKVCQNYEYNVTLEKAPVEIYADYEDWSRNYSDEAELPVEASIEISNAETIVLDETKVVTLAVGETSYEAEVMKEGNIISMYFDIENFAEGTYTFTIPAALYTVDGEANEEVVKTFTYKKPEPVTVKSITPEANSTVEAISEIKITFSDYETVVYQGIITDQDGNQYHLMNADESGTTVLTVIDPLSSEPAPITAPGTYTLDLSELGLAGESVFTWTVAESAVEPAKQYRIKTVLNNKEYYLTIGNTNANNYGHVYGTDLDEQNQDQIFTLVDAGEGKVYVQSATGKYFSYYGNGVGWNVNYTTSIEEAHALTFEETGNENEYRIKAYNASKSKDCYFKFELASEGTTYHPYNDGELDKAAIWTLEEVTNEPVGPVDPIVPETKKFVVENISPVAGEVETIESIVIKFTEEVTMELDPATYDFYTVNLVDADNNTIVLTASEDTNDYSKVIYTPAAPITEDGTYTLDMSQVKLQGGVCEGTYSWTIANEPVVENTLPENGKAYTFTAVWGSTELYFYNNNGTLAVAARGEEALPESAKFICEYDETADYKFQFKTADGAYYLAYPSLGGKSWLDGESATGLEAVSSQVTKFNINPIVPGGSVEATEEELAGLVTLDGWRGFHNTNLTDEFGPIVVKHSAMTFDGASAPFYNSNFTSAIRIEETEIVVPEPEPLTVVNVTPAAGEAVETLEVIEIEFSEAIAHVLEKVNLRKGSQTIAITKIVADGNILRLTLDTPVTEAGTYGFTIGKNKITSVATGVAFGGGNYSIEVIGITNSIEGVDAEAENAVIYDITGRRVNEITEGGIYIINGKKILVK